MHISIICSIFALVFILIYRLCLCVSTLRSDCAACFFVRVCMLYFSFCMLDIRKMIQKIHFFAPKICTYQKKAVPLQRKTKNKTTTKNKNDMKKTYFIDRIQVYDVKTIAKSIDDLEKQVIAFCDSNIGGCTKIYVHCSHVCSTTNTDEQNVEYIVSVNNQKRTITTRRI